MSDKLTIKQDKAAQKYAECGDKSEAYRFAYNTENMKPETINRAAFELFENPKIAARVEELKEKYRKDNEITMEYITRGLKDAIDLATTKEDATNLRGGYVDIAKLHGLYVEKKHVTGDIQMNKKRGAIAERFAKRFMKEEGDDR